MKISLFGKTCIDPINFYRTKSVDTEACLAAVTKFIAKRSYPSAIINESGTSFVATANKSNAYPDEWDNAKIKNDSAQKKIIWKFNTPGAAHIGGFRERLV